MERQEEVFRSLKERFTKELVLAALDLHKNEDRNRHVRLYGSCKRIRKLDISIRGCKVQV